MLSLEQIQLIQQKVEKVIAKINVLEQENAKLSLQNDELVKQNNELTSKIASFEADQTKIEQGLLHALERLNSVENSVLKVGSEQIQSQQVKNQDNTKAPEMNAASQVNTPAEPQNNQPVNNIQNFSEVTETSSNNNEDSGFLPEITEIPETQTEDVSLGDFNISFEETESNPVNTSEKKPYDIF